MKTQIEKNYTVEYAHRLQNHAKHCRFIHGHSGNIVVVFEGYIDSVSGMVRDFGDFAGVETIIEEFDHALVLQDTDPLLEYLMKGIDNNDIPPQRIVVLDCPPTAENLCRDLAIKLTKWADDGDNTSFSLYSVSFEETKGNSVTMEMV